MKKVILLPLITATLLTINSCENKSKEPTPNENEVSEHKEKPTQHLVLPDITTEKQAIEVFKDTTKQLKSKTKLDATELGEIHIITYSLEKAIAYFVDNAEGSKQEIVTQMAVIIEEVHLNSETNKSEETKAALTSYFELSEPFIKGL